MGQDPVASQDISLLRPHVCIANRSQGARDGRDRAMRDFVKLSRRDVPGIPKIKFRVTLRSLDSPSETYLKIFFLMEKKIWLNQLNV